MGRFFGSSGGVRLGRVGGEFVVKNKEVIVFSRGRGHQLVVYEFCSVVGNGGTKVLIWIRRSGAGGGRYFWSERHIVVSVSVEAGGPREILGVGMAVGGFEGS